MSHTQGPWEIVNGCDIYSLKGGDSGDGVPADPTDGWHIASIGDCPTFVDGVETELGSDVKRANANILRMAPQLLLALEDAEKIVRGITDQIPRLNSRVDAYARLIAKARGRE